MLSGCGDKLRKFQHEVKNGQHFRSFDFENVYAAVGSAFIMLALVWGWLVDGVRPDNPSIWEASIALIGAAIMIYWPRI